MGLNPTNMKQLDALITEGMRIATIGRLHIDREFRSHRAQPPKREWFDDYIAARFKDVTIDTLDASAYEGANIIQDLNLPLDPSNADRRGMYDMVIDGGSLEHIFNIPEAFRTYKALLKVGGLLYIDTCANNKFGHGLYQFSSDLFYSALCPDNGFEMVDCFLETHPSTGAAFGKRRGLFTAPDPAGLQRRTQFVSATPVEIHVLARKTSDEGDFLSVVQSDYRVSWGETERTAPARPAGGGLKKAIKRNPLVRIIYDRVVFPYLSRPGANRTFPRKTTFRKP
jgi:hypothetical protein